MNEAVPQKAPPIGDEKPPSGLTIRACRPEDSTGVAELINLPGFRYGTLRLPFHTPAEVRGRIEKATRDDVFLVAVVDNRIVGSAGLHRLSGRQAHVGQIGMGVHDDWTGRGIGTGLLTALINTADRWLGLRRLQLTVYSDNEPAIRLYRRFGFEAEGTHREFALRDGELVDALAMARLGGPTWRSVASAEPLSRVT